jgi:hypothetical protein
VTVVKPAVLLNWPITTSKEALTSLVVQTDALPHAVLTVPLLEVDDTLASQQDSIEDDVCDTGDGSITHTLRTCEVIGLTPASTDEERILKFGSVLRAKLAIK